VEWPTDGPLLIRILIFLGGSGLTGWALRRFPRRFAAWASRRVTAERRALHWEMVATQQQEEIENILRRVEDSKHRAARLDSLLGSSGSSVDPKPSSPLNSSPEVSSPSMENSPS
jgi:hypothetical protein